MKTIKKVLDWINQSNRDKHFKVGSIAIIALLIFGGIIGLEPTANFINANVVIFLLMACVEYKDKLYGNKFDWTDIISGVIPAVVLDVIYLLIVILN